MQIDYSRLNVALPRPIPRICLVTGTDDGLKSEALRTLIAQVITPEFAGFDLEEVDIPHSSAGESMARQILSLAMGSPMFSERRIVVATNIQRLTKEDQGVLISGIENLGEFSCLILRAGTPEYDSGKVKAKSVTAPSLVKAADKAGVVVICNTPDESDLVTRANIIVKAAGKSIASAGLERILHQAKAAAADRGGSARQGDLNVLHSELEKTIIYVGDRTKITEADVKMVCGRSAIDNVFALTDAVGYRNRGRALSALEELMRIGEKPDKVAARALVMLARQLRLIWGVLAMRQGNGARGEQPYLSSEMSGVVARPGYLLRSLQDQAACWTSKELEDAQKKILAYDLELKGISAEGIFDEDTPAGSDSASLLKMLTLELCGIHSKNSSR